MWNGNQLASIRFDFDSICWSKWQLVNNRAAGKYSNACASSIRFLCCSGSLSEWVATAWQMVHTAIRHLLRANRIDLILWRSFSWIFDRSIRWMKNDVVLSSCNASNTLFPHTSAAVSQRTEITFLLSISCEIIFLFIKATDWAIHWRTSLNIVGLCWWSFQFDLNFWIFIFLSLDYSAIDITIYIAANGPLW